jgi:histidine phosphotransfer protein HptB
MKGLYPCGAARPDADATRQDVGREADAAFDPERARRHMGIDRADFRRLFDCIWSEVTERRSLLDEAFRVGDLKQVVLHAHTIKSSAAAIGASALSRAAAAVEQAADAGRMEALSEAMDTLHVTKERLCSLVGLA